MKIGREEVTKNQINSTNQDFLAINMQEIIKAKTKRELNIVMKKALYKQYGEPVDNNERKRKGLPMRRTGRI